ncbi:outer membrane protein assembly factor BamB family protein [Spirosoma flavus]
MKKRFYELLVILGIALGGSGYVVKDNHQAEGTVYFSSQDGTLYALDVRNGKSKWHNKLSRAPIDAAPIVADGIVIQGVSSESALCAVDAATGALRWKYQVGAGPVFSPRISNKTVFVLSDNKASWDLTKPNFTTLHAIDLGTGQLKWTFRGGEQAAGTLASGNTSENCPIVHEGIVYFGGNDGTFYALDSQNGVVKWKYKSGFSFHSSPVWVKGNVYAGDDYGNLLALDAMTGALKWKTHDAFSIHTNIVTDNNCLFVPYDGPSALIAYSCEDGKKRWSFTPTSFIITAPLLVNGFIYLNSIDGRLYAIDSQKGSTVWTKSVYMPNTTPTVADGVMYVGSGNKLCALAADSGKEKWVFAAAGSVAKSACVQTLGGSVYRGLGGIHP